GFNDSSFVRVGGGATVNQSAGTVKLAATGIANVTTLSIGSAAGPGSVSGVYNLTGGQIIDTNSTFSTSRVFVGNTANGLAILNISGTGYMQVPDLRICAQGDSLVTVSNGGSLLISTNYPGNTDSGELSVGRGGHNATMNVYTNGTVI